MTLPGFEPGKDGFQAHHSNHCSISIWMNAGRFPKVLYFPITNLPVGVLLKARPQNRLLLLENIIVNRKVSTLQDTAADLYQLTSPGFSPR